MKVCLALIIGVSIGFCSANYTFNAQKIYETGVKDGYETQRQSVLFVSNTSYQRGWEDCCKAYVIKKKVKTVRNIEKTVK